LGAAINHSTTDPEYLEHLEKARRLLEANPEPYWWEPEWEKALLNLVLAAYLPPTDDRHREHLEVALELFEDVGDTALLAATLGDSAGLWGQGDDEWILGNLHRAAELLSEIEVPYWYGHVLMVLGALLERHGEHEEARQYLSEAVVHLGDCGDVNCWANTSRSLASAEAALGDPVGAGSRVVEVIEKMPILPMPEIHKPRTLDMAAKLLLANGQFGDSAVLLGRAEATELSVPLLYPREEMHLEIREGLVAALGDDEASQLMEKGKAMELDEALELARSRLR
jgi:tetratricopeptide (TPR) repeat protein